MSNSEYQPDNRWEFQAELCGVNLHKIYPPAWFEDIAKLHKIPPDKIDLLRDVLSLWDARPIADPFSCEPFEKFCCQPTTWALRLQSRP